MAFIFDIVVMTLVQLGAMFGVIMVFGICIHYIEKKSVTFICWVFGQNRYFLTAWIGTPVHEFGHYIMCKVFFCPVTDVQWFPVDRQSENLGHVAYRYNPNNIIQRVGIFFISIAPLFSGSFVLIFLLYLLLPNSYAVLNTNLYALNGAGFTSEIVWLLVNNTFTLLGSLFTVDHLLSWELWLFLVLAIGICTHMSLSPSDLQGAVQGLFAIIAVVFVLNLIAGILGLQWNGMWQFIWQYNVYVVGIMLFALCLSLCTLLISVGCYYIKRRSV